jgi:hypothetical protein
MNYVYSTLTCDTAYATYEKNRTQDVNIVKRKIVIKGGAGIANKFMQTPRGVATPVTDEQLAVLKDNPVFKRHLERGFLLIDAKKVAVEKKVANMTKKDKSAPVTPEMLHNGELVGISKDLKEYTTKNV